MSKMAGGSKQKKHRILDHPILSMFLLTLASLILVNILAEATKNLGLDPVMSALVSMLTAVLPPLVIAVLAGRRLEGSLMLGFRRANMAEGLRFAWLFYLVGLISFLAKVIPGTEFDSSMTGIAIALFGAAEAGVAEEIMNRGVVCNLMMRKWRRSRLGVWMAVCVSSLFFGLSHLINVGLTMRMTDQILWQVLYTTALGVLFAAIYVRTRNLWSVIIAHVAMDFPALLVSGSGGGDNIDALRVILSAEMSLGDKLYDVVLIAAALAISVYLLRPSRMTRVLALWND